MNTRKQAIKLKRGDIFSLTELYIVVQWGRE